MAVTALQVASAADRGAWHPARLIPTVGLRSQEEQEKRATSCLLAVMRGVPDFGHALLKELGAPKSPVIQTFTEVRLKDASGKSVIPDGAVVCERGRKTWTCLVEVKTSRASLKPEQVSAYLDVARDNGFDGVLTISNDITGDSSGSPVTVDRRKTRSTKLWHFSWWRIVTEAVVQSRYRGISDPDQAWLLDELIAYLQDPASGAGGFDDMGEKWVAVRKAAHDGTLRAGDPATRDVVERWEEFTEFLSLSLSQELGRSVTAVRPRKQTLNARLDDAVKGLAGSGLLEVTLRVPDAVGDLRIQADLRARQTRTSVTLDAPREGRPLTRIKWLLRQLPRDAPGDLRLEAAYPNVRETVSVSLAEAVETPERLLYPPDVKREPRSFTLTMARRMGQKRGRVEGSFVRETRAQTLDFYGNLVQNLKPFQPRPPRLRDDQADAVDHDHPESSEHPTQPLEPPVSDTSS